MLRFELVMNFDWMHLFNDATLIYSFIECVKILRDVAVY
jgi:hypothetical protein